MILYAIIYFAVSIIWLLAFARLGGGLNRSALFLAFLAGVMVGPPAGIISGLIESNALPTRTLEGAFHLRDFLLYFLIVGPVEELFKFLAVFFTSLRRLDFKNSSDGILLAVAAALGFAGGENIVYLFFHGLQMTWPRLVLGNLGHAAFSACWGYAFGVTLHEDALPEMLIVGLVLASLLHGAYNYFLTYSFAGAALAFALSGALYVLLYRLIRTERRRNVKRRLPPAGRR